MRLRRTMSAIAVTAAVTTAGVAVATSGDTSTAKIESAATSLDFGSVDFGSSELGTPNSVFLWENPAARYIVVLGAKFGQLGQTPQIMTQRLNVAAKLAKQHPFNRIIVSGGDTHWLPISEAQFMNVGLIRRGIPVWQMVNEGASTSTVQNAQNTVRMLKGMGASGALIVTNGFHMERAMKNFRDAAKAQGARLTFRPAYA
ncbi:YdcF family protein [Gordonia westfalica]|uniref:YdcF family protein n=1 Tax=Gordonia westfalica TaxID=158898 RepID=A0ABU2GT57_9ACTN|nr:YdcF family protein [Gordonia westfalica]MDS1114638.1 YdcF family protein [Gordonia westfalica]